MDVDAELAQGAEHHRNGRLDLAARAYKQILLHDPDNVDALHLMSTLALSGGKIEVAVELSGRAVACAPEWFAAHVGLGNALQQSGRLAEAEQSFRAAIERNDQSAEAYCNLSNLLNIQQRHDEAVLAAARAVALDAGLAAGHNNFGNALMALESPDEAATCYRRAVMLQADFAEGWYNLGGALAELDECTGALDAFGHALALRDDRDWRYRLANILARFGRYADAETEYRRVLTADSDHIPALINLSNAVQWQGRQDEARALLADGIDHHPDSPELHWNLALSLLRLGRMAEAWPHYEWRWRMDAFAPYRRDFGRPAWDGVAPLTGRTVLVHTEQGFGDAIQFSRFVPELVRRGAKVVLECRRGLGLLFSTLGDGIQVVETGQPMPDYDLTAPLLSLGVLLGATPDTLPAPPYLSAPPGSGDFSDVASRGGLKVGLVWSGSQTRARNTLRSLSASQYAALMDLDHVDFFGLQVGAADHPDHPSYGDLSPRLGNFADTAAAIMALDVIVTVDTAVAHLAGALGKPAWVVLSTPCDGYFWMLDRIDTPWYPTARLYRQSAEGDWDGVMARVRADLQRMVTGR